MKEVGQKYKENKEHGCGSVKYHKQPLRYAHSFAKCRNRESRQILHKQPLQSVCNLNCREEVWIWGDFSWWAFLIPSTIWKNLSRPLGYFGILDSFCVYLRASALPYLWQPPQRFVLCLVFLSSKEPLKRLCFSKPFSASH